MRYLFASCSCPLCVLGAIEHDFGAITGVAHGYLVLAPFRPYTVAWSTPLTVDEELTLLESQIRRLKIEYEVYFSNPTKKPPTDIEWKVLALIRKFSDGGRLTFSQRFKYNELAQRYAVYSDLWRKKGRIREEGYRRPQDALLSVQGVRAEEHTPQHRPVYGVGQAAAPAPAVSPDDQPMTINCSDPHAEPAQVEKLYQALTSAKKKAGEAVSGNLESFSKFVEKKTSQIRKEHGCHAVEYSVQVENGKVHLKAKAKD